MIAGTAHVLHCRLRGGNANSGRGAARLRSAWATGPLTLRADSGFYSAAVNGACRARALEAEAISVSLIGRMLEGATENQQPPSPPAPPPPGGRFARAPEHFTPVERNARTPMPPRPPIGPPRGSQEDGSAAEGGAA